MSRSMLKMPGLCWTTRITRGVARRSLIESRSFLEHDRRDGTSQTRLWLFEHHHTDAAFELVDRREGRVVVFLVADIIRVRELEHGVFAFLGHDRRLPAALLIGADDGAADDAVVGRGIAGRRGEDAHRGTFDRLAFLILHKTAVDRAGL